MDIQTYVEFACEKTTSFDKRSGVRNYKQLKELILLEEFKSCLPKPLVLHLNKQKIDVLKQPL